MKQNILLIVLAIHAPGLVYAQVDRERMERDIEVAESVLATLLKQNSNKAFIFFNEINGNYVPGYGVILTVPGSSMHMINSPGLGKFQIWGDGNFNYSFNHDSSFELDIDEDAIRRETEDALRDAEENMREAEREAEEARREAEENLREAGRAAVERDRELKVPVPKPDEIEKVEKIEKVKRNVNKIVIKSGGSHNYDSLQEAARQKLLDIMKTFLADYADLLSQLPENERVMITNRLSGISSWEIGSRHDRSLISAEAKKSDLSRYRTGRIDREQLMEAITIVNASAADEVETDLELFGSILDRLYRQDLSKTFFIDNNIHYERLKDFGVIYYMTVYSARRGDHNEHKMPTLGMDVSEEERKKKATELYPKFENELKENVVEYGRTIKSLGDNETLVMNVKLTKCAGCGIPSTLELLVKGSTLRAYGTGSLDRADALKQITMQKGSAQ